MTPEVSFDHLNMYLRRYFCFARALFERRIGSDYGKLVKEMNSR